ncbi:hypothetical protein QA596_00890 [Balneolales bacterium ANBcel1]|nr:hypothetical protein [Balneolales bacterium ANBcel1]
MEKVAGSEQVRGKDLLGVTLVTTDDERRQFLELPYRHYADDPNWVPPLRMLQKELIDTRKNPFYNDAEIALFLAYRNGEVAGRIAAIHNHAYNRHNNDTAGFFGFFESVDNQMVVDLLFRVVRDWLRDRGCTRLLGPMSPGLLDEIGIQIEGFDHRPSIMMPHSKPWYDPMIRKAGLVKEMDLLAYRVTDENLALNRMNRAVDIVRKRTPDLTIRPVNLRKFKSEVDIIHRLFNETWKDNWGFYEINREVIEHMAKGLRMIVDTDLAHVAEVGGKPAGFSIALPDYNQVFKDMDGTLFPTGIFKLLWKRRKINAIRTALTGVAPEFQGRGIDAVLIRESIINGLRRGIRSSEVGWLLENNTGILRVVEKVGAVREKAYRMYSQPLG